MTFDANKWTLPSGQQVTLVDRDQLRFTLHGREFGVPHYLSVIPIPSVPGVFDGSRSRGIKYPILGNDRYGCCYYADACHCVQTWTGNAGQEVAFDAASVVARYLKLSGGDNGLDDGIIFPEWKTGIVGPAGPHKILDEITVDPRDDQKIRQGMYFFCGASYTASLPSVWIQHAGPGAMWDLATPNPRNGHAMHLSGYVLKGQPMPFAIRTLGLAKGAPAPLDFYCDETWALDPPIVLTPAGLKGSDPEVSFQFSLEMFDARGIAPHCGMGYDDLAALWLQFGGAPLPPSPFGPPTPTPLPVPPTPAPTPSRLVITVPQPVPAGSYTLTPRLPTDGEFPMPHAFTFDIADVQAVLGTTTPTGNRLNAALWLAGFAAQQVVPPVNAGAARFNPDDGRLELERILRKGVSPSGPEKTINWAAVLAFLAQLIPQLIPLVS